MLVLFEFESMLEQKRMRFANRSELIMCDSHNAEHTEPAHGHLAAPFWSINSNFETKTRPICSDNFVTTSITTPHSVPWNQRDPSSPASPVTFFSCFQTVSDGFRLFQAVLGCFRLFTCCSSRLHYAVGLRAPATNLAILQFILTALKFNNYMPLIQFKSTALIDGSLCRRSNGYAIN